MSRALCGFRTPLEYPASFLHARLATPFLDLSTNLFRFQAHSMGMEDVEGAFLRYTGPDSDPACSLFWRQWRPRAAAYARAFGGLTVEDRDEIADEAVARAFAARKSFDPGRPFQPWFFSIVRHLALDALGRRKEGHLDTGDLVARPSSWPVTEEQAIKADEARFVNAFVAALPQKDRELASLVYGQDLGITQAASVVGMPTGTAKWRLFTIRKALRRAWEKEYA
ncbi:MAG: hypothetical protein A3J97_10460 [Spirochaetes bacterium RIFOXYC1_FULL_54_7]|nr:MAG: hypothetical protein A3J97_10460 [Spirochaetes bacterium RIFOXYC1_FULL_54_7]